MGAAVMASASATEEIPYYAEGRGRRMAYYFRPAADPINARTLIILHGHTYIRPSKFRDPSWNVFVPVDNFGLNNEGAWWLGEHGDFFIIEAMKAMLEAESRTIGENPKLHFWGSSMGGYASLLYGMMLGAKASFSVIPQTWLIGSHYGERAMKPNFEFIAPDYRYNDLTQYLRENKGRQMPLFFVSANRFDHEFYMEDQIMRFVDACDDAGINYYLEVLPNRGHVLTRQIPESLALIDKYLP